LIKELDTKYTGKEYHKFSLINIDARARLRELQAEYLHRAKPTKERKTETQKNDPNAVMEEIKKLQEECLAFSKSKVEIATQNYDIVNIPEL
jgi:hypothetical protein